MESLVVIGIAGLLLMLILVILGVPIAFSLFFIGIIGLFYLEGIGVSMSQAYVVSWSWSTSLGLVVFPMFILMGQFVASGGIASDLYQVVYRWVGKVPGGVAVATTLACAGFGSISGSSLGTAAVMGSVCVPELKKYKYDTQLYTGCVAASGTIANMIPPSMGLVFFGIFTETSIGKLLIAGIVPGIISALIYAAMILIRCKLNPTLGPPGPSFPWREKFLVTKKVWPVLLLFLTVIGGIYSGIMTPNEAAGFGAFFSFAIVFLMKRLSRSRFLEALSAAGRQTAFVVAIIVGGVVFGRFLVLTGVTAKIVNLIITLEVNRYLILSLLMVMYIFLGTFFEVYAMQILTLPLVMPVILSFGLSPIWFGVIMIKLIEIALITPPIGVIVMVMKTVVPEVPLSEIFKGCAWFFIMDICTLALLILFPQIVLWLPNTMG